MVKETPDSLAKKIVNRVKALEKLRGEEKMYEGLLQDEQKRYRNTEAIGGNKKTMAKITQRIKEYDGQLFEAEDKALKSKVMLMKQVGKAKAWIEEGNKTKALEQAFEEGSRYLDMMYQNLHMAIFQPAKAAVRQAAIKEAKAKMAAAGEKFVNANKKASNVSSIRSTASARSSNSSRFETNSMIVGNSNVSYLSNASASNRSTPRSPPRNIYSKAAKEYLRLNPKARKETTDSELAKSVREYASNYRSKISGVNRMSAARRNELNHRLIAERFGRVVRVGRTKYNPLTKEGKEKAKNRNAIRIE